MLFLLRGCRGAAREKDGGKNMFLMLAIRRVCIVEKRRLLECWRGVVRGVLVESVASVVQFFPDEVVGVGLAGGWTRSGNLVWPSGP